MQPLAVDSVHAACLDLVAPDFVVAAVVAVRLVVVDCVPAVAILAAVLDFGLVAYFDLLGGAFLCLDLVAYFVLVAVGRTVDPVAVALYLYLDDLVAVRMSERRHREQRTGLCP